jgi:hypothetical protein
MYQHYPFWGPPTVPKFHLAHPGQFSTTLFFGDQFFCEIVMLLKCTLGQEVWIMMALYKISSPAEWIFSFARVACMCTYFVQYWKWKSGVRRNVCHCKQWLLSFCFRGQCFFSGNQWHSSPQVLPQAGSNTTTITWYRHHHSPTLSLEHLETYPLATDLFLHSLLYIQT